MTTKIPALTDALGNPVRFRLMPAQRHDSVEVPPLIDGLSLGGLIADKAFDSNALVPELNERGVTIVISQHPGPRTETQDRRCHLRLASFGRNLLMQLKAFKRIAMRACNTDQSFGAMIYLAADVLSSR